MCKELHWTRVLRLAPQDGTSALKQGAQCTEVILKVKYSENCLKALPSSTRDFERMCFLMKSEFLSLEKVKMIYFLLLIRLQRSKTLTRTKVSMSKLSPQCTTSAKFVAGPPLESGKSWSFLLLFQMNPLMCSVSPPKRQSQNQSKSSFPGNSHLILSSANDAHMGSAEWVRSELLCCFPW